MRPTISPRSLLIIALVVLLFASCVQTQSTQKSAPAAPPAQPAAQALTPPTQHWIQDENLRQLMAQIGRRVPSLPAGVARGAQPDSRPVDAADFEKIAALAAGLSQSSDQIVPVVKNIPITESDWRGFTDDAQRLHDQADRLRQSADAHQIDEVQQSMDAINSTCIACHSRYRDFSGQIDLSPGRASAASVDSAERTTP